MIGRRRRKDFVVELAIVPDHPSPVSTWSTDSSYSPRVTDYLAHRAPSIPSSSSATPVPVPPPPPPPALPYSLHPPYSLYDPRRHRGGLRLDPPAAPVNHKTTVSVIAPPPLPFIPPVKRKVKRGAKGRDKDSSGDPLTTDLVRSIPSAKGRSPRKGQEHQPIAPSPLKHNVNLPIPLPVTVQRTRKRKQDALEPTDPEKHPSDLDDIASNYSAPAASGKAARKVNTRAKRVVVRKSVSLSEREGSVASHISQVEPFPETAVVAEQSPTDDLDRVPSPNPPLADLEPDNVLSITNGNPPNNTFSIPRTVAVASRAPAVAYAPDQFPYHTGLVKLNLQTSPTSDIAYPMDIPIGANA